MTAVSPLRLRGQSWRGRRGTLALLALLLALLGAAGVALPGLLAAADEERFAAAVAADGGAAEISMGVSWTDDPAGMTSAMDEVLRVALARLRPELREEIGEAGWTLTLSPIPVTGARLAAPQDTLRLRLGADPDLAARATVDAGALPAAWDGEGELPVALDAAVADALGVAVGDVLTAERVRVRVAGIVAVPEQGPGASARAPFTRVDAERLRDGRQVYTAGAWVAADSIPALGPVIERARVSAYLAIDPDSVHVSQRDELISTVRAATAIGVELPSGVPFEVSSALPTVLARSAVQEATARSLVWLLSAGWITALGAGIVLVAAAHTRSGHSARVLLRARGATEGRILRDAAVDLALVAAPALVVGAGIASILTPAGASAAPVLVGAVAVAVAGLGAAVAIPRLPARRPVLAAVGVLVVLVGAGAVTALLARGYGQGDVLDPWLVSAPATAALAVSVVVAVTLPLLLAVLARFATRRRSTAGWLGARWGTRRGGSLAAVVALVLAVSTATTALTIGAAVSDGLDRAAVVEVGADMRVDPSTAGTLPETAEFAGLDGVAAAARIDEIAEAQVTEDSRPRGIRVFVADTAALARVRPDLPALGPGEALAPAALSAALDGVVAVGGASPVHVRFVDADLPHATGRWLLLDAASVNEPLTAGFVLLDPAGPTVAAAQAIRAVTDAPVVTAHAVRERLAAGSTVELLGAILRVGMVLPFALALAAVIATVLSTQREREDLWAVARLSGGRRGRVVLVLWQVLPAAVVSALAGVATGVVAAVAVQSATDLAAATGGAAVGVAPPLGAWAVAPAVVLGATLAALVAVRLTRPRPLASLVRTGAS